MNTEKIRAAVMVTTLMVAVPLGATGAAAATAGNRSARPAAEVKVDAYNAATASNCSWALNALAVSAPGRHQAAHTVPRPDPSSRLSGLPFGGAGAYNAFVDGTPPYQAAHTVPRPDPSSRLSGLPFGGAADCV
jgi:hypothetical protein